MKEMPRATVRHVSLILILICTMPLFSQDEDQPRERGGHGTLLRGYREILLGSSYEQVQDLLRRDHSFEYRGEPDVSLAPGTGEYVIDSRGRGYVRRGLFQFQEGQLYIIALYLDTQRLDYFQVYNQLQERYGPPADLDPRRAYWEDEATRIELERPLTVRYLDLDVFTRRQRERDDFRALEDLTREQFLENF